MPFVPYTVDVASVVEGFADHFVTGDQMLLDPRPDKTTAYFASASTYPASTSTLYKFDRATSTITSSIGLLNQWSSYGIPDMDDEGFLYYAAPGGLTYSFQKVGKYNVDTMTLD